MGPLYSGAKYDDEYRGFIVGGYDIYRDASNHTPPFRYDVDKYTIFDDTLTGNKLLIKGPSKGINHHIDKIADNLTRVEIYQYEFSKCPNCGNHLKDDKYHCSLCGWRRFYSEI